jgi:hypothetical protein
MPSSPESLPAPLHPQHSIAQDMHQHISTVGALAGRTNPVRSAYSGTCRPFLPVLHFWPCFAVATSLDPLGWSARSSWSPGSCQTLLTPVPGATPMPLPPKCPLLLVIFPCRLHIVHLRICPACGPGPHPVSQFCSEMLLLTTEWPHCNCSFDLHFAYTGPPLKSSILLWTPLHSHSLPTC